MIVFCDDCDSPEVKTSLVLKIKALDRVLSNAKEVKPTY